MRAQREKLKLRKQKAEIEVVKARRMESCAYATSAGIIKVKLLEEEAVVLTA
jgi:hypothetical protein